MTSHIFFALGMWDDAVAANEASWAASAARVARKGLGPAEHGYHAYLWLSYAYLQQGRVDDARRVVDHMGTLLEQAPYAWRRLPLRRRPGGVGDRLRAMDRLAEGHRRAGAGASRWTRREPVCRWPGGHAARRPRGRRAGPAALEPVKQSTSSTPESHHGMSAVSPAETEGVAVTAVQLAGVIALARGEKDRGLALLQQAAEAERQDAV